MYNSAVNLFNKGANLTANYLDNSKKNADPTRGFTAAGAIAPSLYAGSAEQAKLQSELAALRNQIAQTPRLPRFDTLANYNRAKATATSAVTPLYNKKLTQFLEGQGIKRDTKTKDANLARDNNQIALTNTLQDNTTSRVRTGEDLASALEQIVQGRDEFLQDEGTQFDDARRALQEETAAGGATDTGLGQQAIQRQLTDRNISSERQVQEFQNQEQAKQLLATRTIDDLATADTRAGQKKGQEDKAVQIDFDSYMASLANEEGQFRLQNDLDMALEIARQTDSYREQGVQQFISGLAGSGARAQDIALAQQVYGR